MITVSIVEDNTAFREALSSLINETEGMQLLCAYASAEQALDMIQNPPDIAIIDIELPGMTGIELIKKVCGQSCTIQFLVCTIHDDDDHVFAALEQGASGYLLKESTAEQIITAIQELYKGGSPMSPYIAKRVLASFKKKGGGCRRDPFKSPGKRSAAIVSEGPAVQGNSKSAIHFT